LIKNPPPIEPVIESIGGGFLRGKKTIVFLPRIATHCQVDQIFIFACF
jgi:hypothetical protein